MECYGYIVVIRRDGSDYTAFPLTNELCNIGRNQECEIRVQLPQVSKFHCSVSVNSSGRAFITNLSQSNPSALNDIDLGYEDRAELRHDDIFSVADRKFRWEYPPNHALSNVRKDSTPFKRISPQRTSESIKRKATDLLESEKRKRVSFGPNLSPEQFDKQLPPATPVRKGEKTAGNRVEEPDTPSKGLLKRRSPTPIKPYLAKKLGLVDVSGSLGSPKHKSPKTRPDSKTPKKDKSTLKLKKDKKSPKKSPTSKSPKQITPKMKSIQRISESKSPKTKTPVSPKSTTPKSVNLKSMSPRFMSPRFRRSKSGTPKLKTPQSKSPKSNTPKSNTPKLNTPKSNTPKSNTPKSNMPKSITPKSQTSKIKTPRKSTPKKTPKLNGLNFKTPKSTLRKLKKTPAFKTKTPKSIKKKSWADVLKQGMMTKGVKTGPKSRGSIYFKTVKKNKKRVKVVHAKKQIVSKDKKRGLKFDVISSGHMNSPETFIIGKRFVSKPSPASLMSPRSVGRPKKIKRDSLRKSLGKSPRASVSSVQNNQPSLEINSSFNFDSSAIKNKSVKMAKGRSVSVSPNKNKHFKSGKMGRKSLGDESILVIPMRGRSLKKKSLGKLSSSSRSSVSSEEASDMKTSLKSKKLSISKSPDASKSYNKVGKIKTPRSSEIRSNSPHDKQVNLLKRLVFDSPGKSISIPNSVRGVSKSPAKGVSKSPAKGISKSPVRGVSKSPTRDLSELPARGVSKSPAGSISKTPARGISKPHAGRFSKSPAKEVSKSPMEKLVKTPQSIKVSVKSPRDKQAILLKRLAFNSPGTSINLPHLDRTVSESPARGVSKSPARGVSKSPARGVSKSPTQGISKSPVGRESRSPAGSVSKSPAGRLSKSPAGRLSKSSAGRVSKSPAGRVSKSPARRVSKLPIENSALSPVDLLEVEVKSAQSPLRSPGRSRKISLNTSVKVKSVGRPKSVGGSRSVGRPKSVGGSRSVGRPKSVGGSRSVGRPKSVGGSRSVVRPKSGGGSRSVGRPKSVGRSKSVGGLSNLKSLERSLRQSRDLLKSSSEAEKSSNSIDISFESPRSKSRGLSFSVRERSKSKSPRMNSPGNILFLSPGRAHRVFEGESKLKNLSTTKFKALSKSPVVSQGQRFEPAHSLLKTSVNSAFSPYRRSPLASPEMRDVALRSPFSPSPSTPKSGRKSRAAMRSNYASPVTPPSISKLKSGRNSFRSSYGNMSSLDFNSADTPDISTDTFISPLATPAAIKGIPSSIFRMTNDAEDETMNIPIDSDATMYEFDQRETPQISKSNKVSPMSASKGRKCSTKKDNRVISDLFKKNKSSHCDYTTVEGLKQLLKTPRGKGTPLADYTNVIGIRKLISTPKLHSSPVADYTNVDGLRFLLKSPLKVGKSPSSDYTSITGLKKLFKTPRKNTGHCLPNSDYDLIGLKKLLSSKFGIDPCNFDFDFEDLNELFKSPIKEQISAITPRKSLDASQTVNLSTIKKSANKKISPQKENNRLSGKLRLSLGKNESSSLINIGKNSVSPKLRSPNKRAASKSPGKSPKLSKLNSSIRSTPGERGEKRNIQSEVFSDSIKMKTPKRLSKSSSIKTPASNVKSVKKNKTPTLKENTPVRALSSSKTKAPLETTPKSKGGKNLKMDKSLVLDEVTPVRATRGRGKTVTVKKTPKKSSKKESPVSNELTPVKVTRGRRGKVATPKATPKSKTGSAKKETTSIGKEATPVKATRTKRGKPVTPKTTPKSKSISSVKKVVTPLAKEVTPVKATRARRGKVTPKSKGATSTKKEKTPITKVVTPVKATRAKRGKVATPKLTPKSNTKEKMTPLSKDITPVKATHGKRRGNVASPKITPKGKSSSVKKASISKEVTPVKVIRGGRRAKATNSTQNETTPVQKKVTPVKSTRGGRRTKPISPKVTPKSKKVSTPLSVDAPVKVTRGRRGKAVSPKVTPKSKSKSKNPTKRSSSVVFNDATPVKTARGGRKAKASSPKVTPKSKVTSSTKKLSTPVLKETTPIKATKGKRGKVLTPKKTPESETKKGSVPESDITPVKSSRGRAKKAVAVKKTLEPKAAKQKKEDVKKVKTPVKKATKGSKAKSPTPAKKSPSPRRTRTTRSRK